MARSTNTLALALAGSFFACAGAFPTSAMAQQQPVVSAPVRAPVNPQRHTLRLLMRPITIDFQEQRLEDVVQFITEVSGAQVRAMWMDDKHAEGLDPDELITLSVHDVTLLTLLEHVLNQAETGFAENNWQMAETGAIQIGPESRLNDYKRIEIYDINDLLLVLPRYGDVPELDLQSVLQSGQGGGGGGGQGPFSNTQQEQVDLPGKQERAQAIIDLLLRLVEPEQWVDNGGTGGSLNYWQGSLIVKAPDYMHRQINGYPYWPASATTVSMVNGRRWVGITAEPGISTINGFGQQPITAVVGGQLVGSEPGGGG